MKFILIETDKCNARMVDVTDLHEAYKLVDLKPDEVDHATIISEHTGGTLGIAIVVYQFGLLEPPNTRRYFQIGDQLYAGNAVLYAFKYGETRDMPGVPSVNFFANAQAVEHAIKIGQVQRPRTMINDQVIWEWDGNEK